MSGDRESLRPVAGADRSLRRQLTLKDELILALLPTLVVLGVLAFVEVWPTWPLGQGTSQVASPWWPRLC